MPSVESVRSLSWLFAACASSSPARHANHATPSPGPFSSASAPPIAADENVMTSTGSRDAISQREVRLDASQSFFEMRGMTAHARGTEIPRVMSSRIDSGTTYSGGLRLQTTFDSSKQGEGL
jgi:hypothetical protein